MTKKMELLDLSEAPPYGRRLTSVTFAGHELLATDIGMLTFVENLRGENIRGRCYCGRSLDGKWVEYSHIWGACSCGSYQGQFTTHGKWNRKIYYRILRHNRKRLFTEQSSVYNGIEIIPDEGSCLMIKEPGGEWMRWVPGEGIVYLQSAGVPKNWKHICLILFGVIPSIKVYNDKIKCRIGQDLPLGKYKGRIEALERILSEVPEEASDKVFDYFLRLPPVEDYSAHLDCLALDPDALKKPGIFQVQPEGVETNRRRILLEENSTSKMALVLSKNNRGMMIYGKVVPQVRRLSFVYCNLSGGRSAYMTSLRNEGAVNALNRYYLRRPQMEECNNVVPSEVATQLCKLI